MNDPTPVPPLRPPACLSDLALDQMLAGEPQAIRASAHLTNCSRCRARLEELRQAERLPRSWLVSRAARTRRALRRRRLARVSMLAAIAAALVLWLRPPHAPMVRERLKGVRELSLGVYVRTPGGIVSAPAAPARVAPADQIRFDVFSAHAGYFGIIGIDASGAVTPYLNEGERLRPIAAGRQVFEGSVILDDTLGPEQLVMVVCTEPRAIGDLVQAGHLALLQAHGDPHKVSALAIDCRQASFLLEKWASR